MPITAPAMMFAKRNTGIDIRRMSIPSTPEAEELFLGGLKASPPHCSHVIGIA